MSYINGNNEIDIVFYKNKYIFKSYHPYSTYNTAAFIIDNNLHDSIKICTTGVFSAESANENYYSERCLVHYSSDGIVIVNDICELYPKIIPYIMYYLSFYERKRLRLINAGL